MNSTREWKEVFWRVRGKGNSEKKENREERGREEYEENKKVPDEAAEQMADSAEI